MSLNHKKSNWIQCGNMSLPQLSHRVGIQVPPFWQMQINDHASFWAWNFGPAQLVTDGLKRETSFLVYVLASAAHRNALSKGWFLSRSMPCLSPHLIGTVAEPRCSYHYGCESCASKAFCRPFPLYSVRHAASKLMLTVFNLRATLLIFVLLPYAVFCQQAWRA